MRRAVLPALLVVGLCAAPTYAAPSQTVSTSRTTATFDGKTGAGAHYGFVTEFPEQTVFGDCLPNDLDCEETIVHVADPGTLSFSTTGVGTPPVRPMLSAALYAATPGNERGTLLGRGADAVAVTGGTSYILLVRWDDGVGSYTGSLSFTPSAS